MTGAPPEINERVAEAFLAATESNAYAEYLEQNQHVVPAFSGDIEANTVDFRELLDTMRIALQEAGLL